MVKTPLGVPWPFDPVLTVVRPIRMPFRYTCITCSGMLTNATTGPAGESSGRHQYSPGFNSPVGRPVGVPRVWAEGI
jgi:hypothetical protein